MTWTCLYNLKPNPQLHLRASLDLFLHLENMFSWLLFQVWKLIKKSSQRFFHGFFSYLKGQDISSCLFNFKCDTINFQGILTFLYNFKCDTINFQGISSRKWCSAILSTFKAFQVWYATQAALISILFI